MTTLPAAPRAPLRATLGGPVSGVTAQVALLAVLAATTGLGAAGWLAGGTFAVVAGGLLARGLRREGSRLGAANAVTLARAVLVGGVAALAAESVARPLGSAEAAQATALAAVALVLDGIDGHVARRTRTASAVGARFDMEVDAFLLLALGVLLVRPVGWWVLLVGGMRYAFVAAGLALPWLRGELPPRFSRKVVAAAQGITGVAALPGLLPSPLATGALAAALAALCWSFGRDVALLARAR